MTVSHETASLVHSDCACHPCAGGHEWYNLRHEYCSKTFADEIVCQSEAIARGYPRVENSGLPLARAAGTDSKHQQDH